MTRLALPASSTASADIHAAYFNAGGMGIVVGDGQLAESGAGADCRDLLQLALRRSVGLSVDYQFVPQPAYNLQRGPVNVFAGRVHWTF